MVYEFAKYPDETLVVFSDIRKKDSGEEYIRVSFERPTENGFDTVVFELPSYEIVEQDGNYSEEEIKEFRETVEKGAHIYFWSNENSEPIHIHISKGKPTPNSTKVWLTKSGGCILANNNGRIPERELNRLLEIVPLYYLKIVSKWREKYGDDEVKFYC